MISVAIFTNCHNICVYVKRARISPKVRLYYVKYLIWDQFSQQFLKMVTLQKCEKSILNKQVSNDFASQMVIFWQWSDIQKGYSKTRDYLEKSDFSVVADAHAHARDTRVALPHPHEERSVKEICRTIREKSQGDGWGGVCVCLFEGGVGGRAGCVFLQSWFEDGRSKFQPWPPGLDQGRALATQFDTDV